MTRKEQIELMKECLADAAEVLKLYKPNYAFQEKTSVAAAFFQYRARQRDDEKRAGNAAKMLWTTPIFQKVPTIKPENDTDRFFTLSFALVEYGQVDQDTATVTAKIFCTERKMFYNAEKDAFTQECHVIKMTKTRFPHFAIELPDRSFPAGHYFVEFNARDEKGFHLKDFADFRIVSRQRDERQGKSNP